MRMSAFTFEAEVSDQKTGILKKKIKGTTYVYYEYGRKHLADRKYNVPGEDGCHGEDTTAALRQMRVIKWNQNKMNAYRKRRPDGWESI